MNGENRGRGVPNSGVPGRCAFSLLEVILALAILALAMPILTQLAQSGMSSAQQAQDLAQATIICESVMAEVVAGAVDSAGVISVPVEDHLDTSGEPIFYYSVFSEATDQTGLLKITVVVDSTKGVNPIAVELVRWMVDPDYAASVAEAAAAATEAAATSSAP